MTAGGARAPGDDLAPEDDLGLLTVRVPVYLPFRAEAGGWEPFYASPDHFVVLSKHLFGRRRTEDVQCEMLGRSFAVAEAERLADLVRRLVADAEGALRQEAAVAVYGEPLPALPGKSRLQPRPVIGALRLGLVRPKLDFTGLAQDDKGSIVSARKVPEALLQVTARLLLSPGGEPLAQSEALQVFVEPGAFAQALTNVARAAVPYAYAHREDAVNDLFRRIRSKL